MASSYAGPTWTDEARRSSSAAAVVPAPPPTPTPKPDRLARKERMMARFASVLQAQKAMLDKKVAVLVDGKAVSSKAVGR